MAEVKYDSLNSSIGRALGALDFAGAKSAFTEIECSALYAKEVAYG